jgi:hypothetical protein
MKRWATRRPDRPSSTTGQRKRWAALAVDNVLFILGAVGGLVLGRTIGLDTNNFFAFALCMGLGAATVLTVARRVFGWDTHDRDSD